MVNWGIWCGSVIIVCDLWRSMDDEHLMISRHHRWKWISNPNQMLYVKFRHKKLYKNMPGPGCDLILSTKCYFFSFSAFWRLTSTTSKWKFVRHTHTHTTYMYLYIHGQMDWHNGNGESIYGTILCSGTIYGMCNCADVECAVSHTAQLWDLKTWET